MTGVVIRPADLVADRDVIVQSLLEHLTARSTQRRFSWFYEQNPHGPASAWLATDGDTGSVIGSGAIMPRLLYVAGVLRPAVVMADFWIHPEHRSLGPAVKLQRACVDGAAKAGFALFDLPQQSMPAVYRRMKLLGDEQMIRFAKPLRAKPYVERVLGGGMLADSAAAVGDFGLALLDSFRARKRSTVERHDGDFGAEFSKLAEEVSPGYGTCVARSAEFLRWRYREHYYLQYEVYTARRARELVAYAVVLPGENAAEIVDLFGHGDRETIVDLLLGTAMLLRSRGVATISLGLHASARWSEALTAAGFRRRDARPLVIHQFERAAPPTGAGWYLSYGDIDY